VATVCSILLPTYTETDVQHWFCPPVLQEADALLRARVAGWLDQNEFEEAILQLFVLSVRTEGKSPSTRRLQVGPPADHLPYSVEEILEDNGLTVSSLVVRFTLPDHIKNADCLQLLFEPDAAYTGGALAVKSADANGELQQLCCVVLPITVDQGGTQANLMIPPEDADLAGADTDFDRQCQRSASWMQRSPMATL